MLHNKNVGLSVILLVILLRSLQKITSVNLGKRWLTALSVGSTESQGLLWNIYI